MAAASSPRPYVGEKEPSFASLLHSIPSPSSTQAKHTPPVIKRVEIVHGEPTIQWTSKEFDEFSVQEGLQFALVAKFAYGRPEAALDAYGDMALVKICLACAFSGAKLKRILTKGI
ncbi:hypothetical protein RND71_028495 [Anisodus tanguticus]|uniref:Uncharacterized protein n=1 Tax=Anisodus tanguticus TaxID=243964 RepID=A0AAE1RL56_9SOLA|nr:hypothetical protein RND71_028495 [Anisodus tanguticus]